MLLEKRQNKWKAESVARGISALPQDHFLAEMVMSSRMGYEPLHWFSKTKDLHGDLCSHPLMGSHLNRQRGGKAGLGPTPAQTLKTSVVTPGL